MALTGDFKKLEKFKRKMHKLTGVHELTAKRVAPILKSWIQSEFVTKTDPDGDPWESIKPITYKKGTISVLVRSGKMAQDIGATAIGSRVKIVLGTPYARYFISTKWSVLPRGGAKRPERWANLITTEYRKAVVDIMNGKTE